MLDYQARTRVESGADPASILFGADTQSQGWAFVDAPVLFARLRPRLRLARRATMFARRALGSAYQALWVARKSHGQEHAVIYCAAQWLAGPALLLKRIGWIRHPIVVVVHGVGMRPTKRGGLHRADALIALSGRIRDLLAAQGAPRDRIHFCNWGPDLEWEPYNESPHSERRDVVMFGKSHRESSSVRAAALAHKWRADLFHDGLHFRIEGGTESEHTLESRLSGHEMVSLMKSARAIAIPVAPDAPGHALTGLTELMDAIAVGKPVLMPFNPNLPFDIEQAGVGVWVAPGCSPEEYRQAMEVADSLPLSNFAHMRAKWNTENFRGQVVEVLSTVVSMSSSTPKAQGSD